MTTDAQEAELARLLVDSVVDYAIFVLDPTGVVRTWNPGAERLKGYARDEIVGRHFSAFYPETDREAGLPQRLLAQATEDGRVRHTGWRLRADGRLFWGDVTITALRNGSGTLVGFAKVTRDLTSSHELEVARERALERERAASAELADLDRLRRRLFAGISHDLTTPIVAAAGALEVVLAEPSMTESERVELLEMAARNLGRLRRLTDQLRELARAEAGPELEPERIDVRAAVSEFVADLGPLLGDRHVEIDAADDVTADRLAFERIVVNLLTNAAQHTAPDGRIEISTHREEEEVVVAVRDDGAGLPPEDADRVFGEFERGAGGDGLGLGLSIVRRYVEQHGGRVWVESTPGAGATFRATFPATT